jgi:hypothetical protein
MNTLNFKMKFLRPAIELLSQENISSSFSFLEVRNFFNGRPLCFLASGTKNLATSLLETVYPFVPSSQFLQLNSCLSFQPCHAFLRPSPISVHVNK